MTLIRLGEASFNANPDGASSGDVTAERGVARGRKVEAGMIVKCRVVAARGRRQE
jgi:hypothetical protein